MGSCGQTDLVEVVSSRTLVMLHIPLREGVEGAQRSDLAVELSLRLSSALRESTMYPVECVMIVISHRKDPEQQLPLLQALDLRQQLGVIGATSLLELPEPDEELRDPLLHAGVPVVLDGVVSAALDLLRDIRPAVAVSLVEEVEDPFFLVGPAVFLDMWV